jgi:DNA-directed RNA polymerase specialized sigma24 family protein
MTVMPKTADNPTIEHMLEHVEWVRRFARQLVGDRAEAEEVVQDTWLAALRKSPESGPSMRGWFRKVVANFARQRRRSEGRLRPSPATDRPLRSRSTGRSHPIPAAHRTITTARAGSLCVVPRGCWHRLLAREFVKLCGVTPGPTEHSDADDPPE